MARVQLDHLPVLLAGRLHYHSPRGGNAADGAQRGARAVAEAEAGGEGGGDAEGAVGGRGGALPGGEEGARARRRRAWGRKGACVARCSIT